jgi:CheY-like chemotaxis protein
MDPTHAQRTIKKVLIVDDNADIRQSLARLLRVFGIQSAVAADGQEALDRLRADTAVGLIVLDLMMPVMDGWEFRHQQVEDPDLAAIPVVVCSGGGNISSPSDFDGVVGFHRKPVDPRLLIDLARRCCSA